MLTFGQRVLKARKKAGLSQAQLAKAVGVTQQAAQAWEDESKARAGSKHVAKIAEACNVSALWLSRGGNQSLTSMAESSPPHGEVEEAKVQKLMGHIRRLIAHHSEDVVHEAFIRVFTVTEAEARPRKATTSL